LTSRTSVKGVGKPTPVSCTLCDDAQAAFTLAVAGTALESHPRYALCLHCLAAVVVRILACHAPYCLEAALNDIGLVCLSPADLLAAQEPGVN